MRYYRLVERDDISRSFPIGWNKLPDELLDELPEYYIEDNIVVLPSGELSKKSFVYVVDFGIESEEQAEELLEKGDVLAYVSSDKESTFCIDVD